MSKMDYETKMNSKAYRFFDLIYRLIVVNVMTIILSVTVVLIYPAVIAATQTLKEGPTQNNLFVQYFTNFKTYFKKSFLIGLIVIILYAVISFAIYFYGVSKVKDGETDNVLQEFLNIGFLVSFVGFIILTFLSSHLPLLITTFKSLTIMEILRTGFYVTFRYFLSTLILFICNIVMIGGFVFALFVDARILAIWMLIGLTLPIFLGVKLTAAVYYKFSQINLEKIMHMVEEDDDEE